MTKEEIRQAAREQRGGLTDAFVRNASNVIQETVIALDAFRVAATVGMYVATGNEVRTDRIVEVCWQQDKSVYIPAFCDAERRYRLAGWSFRAELVTGHWGVLEPNDPQWMDPDGVALMVIPGVAFDRGGGRVGHGGGHYDRLLARASADCLKVGLCFECQVFDEVPLEETDVQMDIVVTEQRVLNAKAALGGH